MNNGADGGAAYFVTAVTLITPYNSSFENNVANMYGNNTASMATELAMLPQEEFTWPGKSFACSAVVSLFSL